MAADEVRIAEAIASLTARLETWAVEDPHAKAHAYITDMVRNGWRPRALPVHAPPMPGRISPPTDDYRRVRAALRAREETP